ncbi:MAG: bifunctional diaminohydroxyphosphoribosylaminopyrimidine deaminase/5-amino-6-(5-phosphoribosylamino)uracil reductase RibD [Planctomycetaceae bacterium]
MAVPFADPPAVMRRALELAASARGCVEPNPMVGAVIVDEALRPVGEGRHERFGGPHAEVAALDDAGDQARGATLFVTLEPCRHFGKTPPCTRAVIAAGIRRVVVAMEDPSPHAAGRGIAELRAAGIEVEVGLSSSEAERLVAPFVKRVRTGRPWVHAKWAMTLDGKIATRTGSSRWISNDRSRAVAHGLRGRMDAIVIGGRTAERDDPLLTARPPGPRVPTRIVVDRDAGLSPDSQLVRTLAEAPLLVVASPEATEENVRRLTAAGVEVLRLAIGEAGDAHAPEIALPVAALLDELGRREMTNVLVEGGGELLGAFFDAGEIDEAHVFIAPKLVGGRGAVTPLAGIGLAEMPAAFALDQPQVELLAGDVYIHGRPRRER